LSENGFPDGGVEIIARTGWTTDELAQAIDRNEPHGTFDLVTLLIGVNNQYRGRSLTEYRDEFRALLERAIAFAGNHRKRVIVISIPDWGVTPFGLNRADVSTEVNSFNEVNRRESAVRGVHYIDITPMSRTARHNEALTAADGLHPSGVMYREWVNAILPAAMEALRHRV
jgi:lysophospholipase L1-like esterase